MKKVLLTILVAFSLDLTCGQQPSWEQMISKFIESHEKLQIAPIHLSYLDNLRGIQRKDSVERQIKVFEALKNDLKLFNRERLSTSQQLEYDLLEYYSRLNEERLALEQKWLKNPIDNIPSSGIANLPDGKEWYVYFLKRWLDITIRVEELYELGLAEIEKVKSHMKSIQQNSGMDSLGFQQYLQGDEFYLKDQNAVQQAFEAYAKLIHTKLNDYFPKIGDIPLVRIERGADARLAQTPAYYSGGTFYYNLFDKPFNKRQIGWIFIHEAVPGHHYEISYQNFLSPTPLLSLFNNPGYSEGWAAYIEDVAREIGLYRNIYDEYGKWEWDLIRSVRVPLDIGLNYYAWTDEKALDFWRQHIKDLDDIGLREIARMRRWPCQVISYKYGAHKIRQWQQQLRQHADFTLMDFHAKVLKNGRLPFSILEKQVFRQ